MGDVPDADPSQTVEPDGEDVARAAALLAAAERPAIIAGSDVYWAGAWDELAAVVDALRVPTFVNGLGRGCLPADHELAFSRIRGLVKEKADVVCVVGTPLDFRISFGSFGDAEVIHIVDSPDQRASHVTPVVSPAGDLRVILAALAEHTGELEPVPRESGGETNLWMPGMPIHDEMFVGRHRIHADGVGGQFTGGARQVGTEERFDLGLFLDVDVAIDVQRIVEQVAFVFVGHGIPLAHVYALDEFEQGRWKEKQ